MSRKLLLAEKPPTKEELRRFFKCSLNYLLDLAKHEEAAIPKKLAAFANLSQSQISLLRNLDKDKWGREDKRRLITHFFGLQYDDFIRLGQAVDESDLNTCIVYSSFVTLKGPNERARTPFMDILSIPGQEKAGYVYEGAHGSMIVELKSGGRYLLLPIKESVNEDGPGE